MEHQHPIATAPFHAFERTDKDGSGFSWVGVFHPQATYPVLFSAPTEADLIAKADTFRADAIAKHGAAHNARMKLIVAGRERAAAKAAAKTAAQ